MSVNKFLSQYITIGWIQTYSFFEALLSIMGIEGMLVAFGIYDGHKRGHSVLSMGWATALSMLISVMAGLGQSVEAAVNLPPEIATVIQGILVIVTGIGVPILAFLGAQVYGGLMFQHEIDSDKWLKDAKASWMVSPARKLATRGLRRQIKYSENVPTQNNGKALAFKRLASAADLLIWYRNQNGLPPGQKVSAKAVALAALEEANIDPTEQIVDRLSGAIRTAQTRENADADITST